jgi:hypothetical protein
MLFCSGEHGASSGTCACFQARTRGRAQKRRPSQQQSKRRRPARKGKQKQTVCVVLFFMCIWMQVRSKAKPKAKEQLVEASDRVARGAPTELCFCFCFVFMFSVAALEQLAELESEPDADVRELERLVQLVDEEQATLFDALPSPAQSRKCACFVCLFVVLFFVFVVDLKMCARRFERVCREEPQSSSCKRKKEEKKSLVVLFF